MLPSTAPNKLKYYDLRATSYRIDAGARASQKGSSKAPWRQRGENEASFGFSSESR